MTTRLVNPDGVVYVVGPEEVAGLLRSGWRQPNAQETAAADRVAEREMRRGLVASDRTQRRAVENALVSGTAVTAAGLTAAQQANGAQYQSILAEYGLDGLAGFVEGWIRQGLTWDQVWLQLMDPSTDPGKVVDRIYPELREVREAGLPSVTIGDVLNNRRLTIEGLHMRGVSQYIDPKQLAHQWTVGGISINEGLARVDAVLDDALAFARNDPEVAPQLEAWERFYNVNLTAADVLGMATKPNIALQDVQRRAAAVRFDVEAGRAGFGDLSVGEAEHLTDLGVDAKQSGATFGSLVSARELFTPLDASEDTISRQEQLAGAFSNDAAARKRIADRARKRAALGGALGGGGRLATSRSGFGGLSTSSDT